MEPLKTFSLSSCSVKVGTAVPLLPSSGWVIKGLVWLAGGTPGAPYRYTTCTFRIGLRGRMVRLLSLLTVYLAFLILAASKRVLKNLDVSFLVFCSRDRGEGKSNCRTSGSVLLTVGQKYRPKC
jgi:hypothetical protein